MTHKPCVYCGCPWPYDEHKPDCPSNTNLWPVLEREVSKGMCCGECADPFTLGEYYTLRRESALYALVICLSCAARAVVE